MLGIYLEVWREKDTVTKQIGPLHPKSRESEAYSSKPVQEGQRSWRKEGALRTTQSSGGLPELRTSALSREGPTLCPETHQLANCAATQQLATVQRACTPERQAQAQRSRVLWHAGVGAGPGTWGGAWSARGGVTLQTAGSCGSVVGEK